MMRVWVVMTGAVLMLVDVVKVVLVVVVRSVCRAVGPGCVSTEVRTDTLSGSVEVAVETSVVVVSVVARLVTITVDAGWVTVTLLVARTVTRAVL
jgi:hypothetical protein